MSLATKAPASSRVAVLSAAASSESGAPIPTIGGETILWHQISALRRVGIRKFLIEVDSVQGALLAMADKLTQEGNAVDFTRSAQDLQSKLGDADNIIVQAEGIYIAPQLLAALIEQNSKFVATIDGRSENEAFERMDLNTRWAGLAVLPAHTVERIGVLPDGWSLTSSLLRQAMRDGIAQQAVKQTHMQDGDLCRVDSPEQAEKLAHTILLQRAGQEPGFIEARIFGPLSAKFAPSLWRLDSRALLTNGTVVGFGVVSLALTGLDWTAGAIGAAIAAIFANSLRQTVNDSDLGNSLDGWIEPILWTLLSAALIRATTTDVLQFGDGLFAGCVVVGLAILARHLRLPDWAQKALQSPALTALSLLLLSSTAGIASAAKWVGAVQLALLIAAKWDHKPKV